MWDTVHLLTDHHHSRNNDMVCTASNSSSSSDDAASRLRSIGYNPTELVQQYRDSGYIIIPDVLSSEPASQLNFSSLRAYAEAVTELTRSGRWPHRRIVGNAFPPFTQDNRDSWGVQHIMNPALGPASSVFQEFYSSSPLLDIASLILSVEETEMQMELFNLLINPSSHRFALGWHRDDIRPDVSASEEKQRLETPTYGVQFNTALFDDDCLFIVPGTHRRLRTPEEVQANLAKAPPATATSAQPDAEEGEDGDGTWQGVDPPNTLRVRLKAGETVFYSQRILHRASYLPTAKRATLHGCFGDASEGGEGAKERARNILQHGVEWMREPEFGKRLNDRLKPSEFTNRTCSKYGKRRCTDVSSILRCS